MSLRSSGNDFHALYRAAALHVFMDFLLIPIATKRQRTKNILQDTYLGIKHAHLKASLDVGQVRILRKGIHNSGLKKYIRTKGNHWRHPVLQNAKPSVRVHPGQDSGQVDQILVEVCLLLRDGK